MTAEVAGMKALYGKCISRLVVDPPPACSLLNGSDDGAQQKHVKQ